MENRLSTRLSIRKRGSSGGHHQAMEIEDRFGHWRSEEVGDLIWGLGAMAAEHVFYGQNTTGVGGDIGIGDRARRAHGRLPRRWRPAPIDLSDRIEDPERARGGREAASRSASRSSATSSCTAPAAGCWTSNPFAATLGDPAKRRLVAGLLGQAFVVAYAHDPRQPRGDRARRRRGWSPKASSTATTSIDAARRRARCASPRSTCWTRPHGRRSDPAALARRRARRRDADGASASERRPSPPPAARRGRRAGRRRAEPSRVPRRASGSCTGALARRRSSRPRCVLVDRARQRRRRRGTDADCRELVDLAARRTATRSTGAARDRRRTSGASTGSTTAPARRRSSGPLADRDVPLEVALRRRGRRHRPHQRHTACSYTLNGSGPNGSITRRQADHAAPPAAAPRGARARAVLVPLPRRTSTWSSRCCRRRRRRPRRRRAEARRAARRQIDARLLPAGRPAAAAPGAAARDARRQDAAPEDDRRPGGRADRPR